MSCVIHADITPLGINRTAMYHVVKDTLKGINEAGFSLVCSALGHEVSVSELVDNKYCLTEQQDREIMTRLQACLADHGAFTLRQSRWTEAAPLEEGIALAFDPLYLPFVTKRHRTLTYVLDLTPLTRPAWHNPVVSLLYRSAYQCLYSPSIESISISHSTTRDLWANLGIPPSRVHTVHLYNRFEGTSLPRLSDARSFLFVGSLEPRKNLVALARAFELSQLYEDGYTLRIVGQHGHNAEHIFNSCSAIQGVQFLGRLSDDELAQEYQSCACLVFPSLWEGFGLPALEALAMNIPLLLSDTGALPEIGGQFADFVDPCNELSIAQGLRRAAQTSTSCERDERHFESWIGLFTKEKYLNHILNLLQSS